MALVDLTQKGTYTKVKCQYLSLWLTFGLLIHFRHLQPLRHEQQYRVDILMHVPSSEINFDVGKALMEIVLCRLKKVAY